MQREQLEIERLERERLEAERLERERLERDRLDREERARQERENKMAPLTETDFLRIAGQTIARNFSGDPLALQAFINSINLLKRIANDGNHHELLKEFLLTKLEAKALESISAQVQGVDEIVTALRGAIRPDSSKVIAGRMAALRVRQGNYEEFTTKVEELADGLRRALVVEGISAEKAREMTVDKTVELCSASTKSSLVKSVLASTPFKDPSKVVAKLVVQSANEEKKAQILAFRANRGRPTNRYNRNFRGNHNNNRNGNRNRNYNGYNGGNGDNSNRNGYRGNGNGRGGRGGGGRGRYGNGNNGRPQWNNNANVRYTENVGGPLVPQNWRAEQNSQPGTAQQFHVPYQQ